MVMLLKTTGFNPRTHESATAIPSLKTSSRWVSIHALMRVRPVLVDAEDNYDQFQSTHS